MDFMGYVSFREGKPNVGQYSRHAGIWEGFKKGLAAGGSEPQRDSGKRPLPLESNVERVV